MTRASNDLDSSFASMDLANVVGTYDCTPGRAQGQAGAVHAHVQADLESDDA